MLMHEKRKQEMLWKGLETSVRLSERQTPEMLKPAVSHEECTVFESGDEGSRQQLLAFRGFIRCDISLTGLWQRAVYMDSWWWWILVFHLGQCWEELTHKYRPSLFYMMRCSSDPDIVPSRSTNTPGTLQALKAAELWPTWPGRSRFGVLPKNWFMFQSMETCRNRCAGASVMSCE